MLLINYFIFLLLFVVILRPFSTLVHELGHGIPALLLTNKKVTLYLGSYGNPKDSFKFVIGRLELFLHKKPFHWKIGLCVFEQNTLSINKLLFINVMGPLTSLGLSIILSYIVFFGELNENVKFILFFFNVTTYYEFYRDIVPHNEPIELHDGTTIFNDGKQILELLKAKKIPNEYYIGVEYYNTGDYEAATLEIEKALNKGYQENIVYQLLISAYLQVKDYINSERINNLYSKKAQKEFNSNDYSNSGLIKSFFGNYKEAIKDYDKAIEMDPGNSYALNNRGYTYNIIGDYENAIKDFDKAILFEENFAYAINNRGFAKIKLGFKEDGLKDLEKSMKMDGTNSYCYFNFGVYYYEESDYQKALEYFNKARELDSTTYKLDSYIEKVMKKLST